MDIRLLRYFSVLADELHFGRAAARLYVAQPALSQQIRALEERLGAQLVDRKSRPLRLTEAGSYFCIEARQILQAYEQASLGARAIGSGTHGWLAIGFTRSAMYSVLPPAIKAFHAAYPKVELKLYEMLTEAQAEQQLIAFLSQHVPSGKSPLCGNSISQDRRFMFRYMPTFERFFHYRNLDVSTLKELARRWAPKVYKGFEKKSRHEALADIYESIDELKYYREHLLKL